MFRFSDGLDKNKIPAAFIERYRTADGPSLKVALWLFFDNPCDIDLMAAELTMPETTVRRALSYWEKAGLLVQSDEPAKPSAAETGAKRVPEQEPVAERRKLTTSEIARMSLRNPDIAILLQESQRYLGKTISNNESERLVEIYTYDELPVDVILLIIGYSKKRAKRNLMGYIERVSREWKNDGVDSVEKAEKHLKLLEKRERREKKVCDVLDVPHEKLSYRDRQYIAAWHEEYGYNIDFVAEALLHGGNNSVAYINGILKNWNKNGFKSVKDTRAVPTNAPAPVRKTKSTAQNSGSLIKKAALKYAEGSDA